MVETNQEDMIVVEVAYADQEQQLLMALSVPLGTTAQQAIEQSNILQHITTDNLTPKIGIFGQPCLADSVLAAHDRVELYRPLQYDPKDARRLRAAKK